MPKLSGLALSRSALDRRAEHRSDEELAAYWSDPRVRVLPLVDGQAPVGANGDELIYLEASGHPEIAPYFLGIDEDGVPYFATEATSLVEAGLADGTRLARLRDSAVLLNALDAGAFVHARALSLWHAAHPFCSACGEVTEVTSGGHVRRCPHCGAQHFPRTDPAIIVLVTDDRGRALLARNAQWPPGRFSTVAGFVEPGEALEAAVVREVHEETGIVVTETEYAGNQPWPFPSSLMIGFVARAGSERIAVDEAEIAEARWFAREELRAAYASGEIGGPTAGSIAGGLIRLWLDGPDPVDARHRPDAPDGRDGTGRPGGAAAG